MLRSFAMLLEPGQLEPGTYDLRIIVDPDANVPEGNEMNNGHKARLAIEPGG